MTVTPENAPLLLTDDDVHDRVAAIVGPAARDGCVWLMLVDGDRRQTPVVIPIGDSPRHPETHLVAGLRDMLAHLAGQLATDAGPGACLFALERFGPRETGPADEEWARALHGAASGAGLGTVGVFLSTPDGVRRVR
ncbi:hypothetical protein EV188_10844 [Actinomycetospora succinea]|uniref:Uncharacterized protein n=1 Tax=Actinomycetospora succinea TaxID=663603 RepID=A0A4R6V652_9PSEU|nr:hypothetical protein [Actinomycetospora succinea]TDQ51684.1 hypothetical protein EV188_10844 [Actinomycetospora succinea]